MSKLVAIVAASAVVVVTALVLLVLVVRQRFDPSCAAVECPDGYRLVDGAAQIAGSSTAQCCVVAYDAEAEADQQRQRAAEEAGEEAGDRAAALYGEAYRQTAALLALRMARAGVPTGRAIAKGLEQAKEEAELAEAMARAAQIWEDQARAEAEASAAEAEASAAEARAFVEAYAACHLCPRDIPGIKPPVLDKTISSLPGSWSCADLESWLEEDPVAFVARCADPSQEIEVGPDTLTLQALRAHCCTTCVLSGNPCFMHSDCCAGLVCENNSCVPRDFDDPWKLHDTFKTLQVSDSNVGEFADAHGIVTPTAEDAIETRRAEAVAAGNHVVVWVLDEQLEVIRARDEHLEELAKRGLSQSEAEAQFPSHLYYTQATHNHILRRAHRKFHPELYVDGGLLARGELEHYVTPEKAEEIFATVDAHPHDGKLSFGEFYDFYARPRDLGCWDDRGDECMMASDCPGLEGTFECCRGRCMRGYECDFYSRC
jgi:hypothetical protein